MAITGFVERFKGKIKAHIAYIGAGGIRFLSGALVRQSQSITLPVTAATNTDFTMSLPVGAIVLAATVFTTTGYGAVTDAKIQIGASAGDNAYVAATSIKAAGIVVLSLLSAAYAALLSLPAAPNLFIRIVQSGGNSATGAGTLVVEYLAPNGPA